MSDGVTPPMLRKPLQSLIISSSAITPAQGANDMTRNELNSSCWHDPSAPVPERDLAERWQRSIRTLQRWRAEGYGPAHMTIGGSVFYRTRDILEFEARMRRGGMVDQ
ncbi:helix-turn-helix domain-containing protein [Sinirhodobacter sp. HNIBRBA609]|nr:helix-turn-helix domain-containing protein [Sinirhodobacter sp. HNIBRBA609]